MCRWCRCSWTWVLVSQLILLTQFEKVVSKATATTADEEEAQHGNQSKWLHHCDEAPHHCVHDREVQIHVGPVGPQAGEVKFRPPEDRWRPDPVREVEFRQPENRGGPASHLLFWFFFFTSLYVGWVLSLFLVACVVFIVDVFLVSFVGPISGAHPITCRTLMGPPRTPPWDGTEGNWKIYLSLIYVQWPRLGWWY